MSQPDKKLGKFSSAILKDAQEQRGIILAEIEEYRKAQMEKAEEDVLHEAYIMIQNEISAIKNQQSRKISITELEGRRSFLKHREEIMSRVFKETSERLLAFTGTAEYEKLICALLQKSAGRLSGGALVIQVRHADLPLADKLINACGRSAMVEENISISLGGFILVNKDMGVIIDETLDLKLSSQKDWFAASSGLTLGL
jgi:V/A-type H+-transporting ATPase subunit E